MKPTAFAVLGPTAGGKTALALALAEHLPLEIISLDSALVYRGMDIGTAKPTAAERAAVPHHLIDIIDPPQSYSAAEFVADCTRLVHDIHARGRLPLIVGGTMMYYHALSGGLNELPAADETVRARLQREKAEHGLSGLYRRLQEADPETARRLAPADSQRIERALEVWLLTGKPLSEHLAVHTAGSPLNLAALALIPADRARLHRQIDQRFRTMLDNGLIDEVRTLSAAYPELSPDSPALRCVGYRQTRQYLAGEYGLEELREKGSAATRQLAKRQLTWLRKLPVPHRIDPFDDPHPLQTALACCRAHFEQGNA